MDVNIIRGLEFKNKCKEYQNLFWNINALLVYKPLCFKPSIPWIEAAK